jgi:hypothetical protein
MTRLIITPGVSVNGTSNLGEKQSPDKNKLNLLGFLRISFYKKIIFEH